ncbi:hypothetical protein [Staphylococcus haemolyticus]|uniref:hypothetical protein n=1 Tax=Staphylococcus haemolyticus TaxID=1283 RepID=UPI001F26F692|nr:hypothetical protein [Staphylococcus haemolyticus]
MPENKQRSDTRQNKVRILGTVNQLSQQGVDISEMKMTEIAKQANVGSAHCTVILKIKLSSVSL